MQEHKKKKEVKTWAVELVRIVVAVAQAIATFIKIDAFAVAEPLVIGVTNLKVRGVKLM